MKKGERKHKGQYENIDEVLKVSDGVAAWIKDFQQSDAPQFKGKSMDKRKEMALAAYLDAKKGSKEEQVDEWSCNQTERSRRVKGGDKRKKYMKEKQVEEKKKGLWDRIHAKRKRGEPPAKPGEKGYPKTLDVGEGLKQARKNVGSDSCWDGYKATGTKMKNGKEVPDCKKEGKFDVKANMRRKNDATQFVKQTGKALDQNHKDTMAALKDLQKRRKMREGIEEGMDHWIVKMPDQPGVKGKRNVPVKARTSREAIMKAAKRLGVDWKSVDAQAVKEGSSAQDRLSARAAKHGLGKPNKAADDYLAKMMKKYGAKDMADLKKKMGMKESWTLVTSLHMAGISSVVQQAGSRKQKHAGISASDKRTSWANSLL